MKLISNHPPYSGTRHTVVGLKVQCPTCKAEMEIEEGDNLTVITTGPEFTADGAGRTEIYLNCASCNRRFAHFCNTSDMPTV